MFANNLHISCGDSSIDGKGKIRNGFAEGSIGIMLMSGNLFL